MDPITERETQRLAALDRYAVMDTPREASFDELAALTARLCEAPIAVINLVAADRQFFKAEVGLGVRATPLESSFCVKALLEDDLLVVPDLTRDPRFDCNPLVVGEPHIRAYAGALLKTDDGLAIGTLCVLDHRVRPFTDLQQETLRVLSRQVMAQLDLRRAVEECDRRYGQLRASEERLRLILDSARDYAIVTTDTDRRITSWSAGAEATFEWTEQQAIGRPIDDLFLPEDRRAGIPARECATAAAEGCAPDVRWHLRADGTRVFMTGSTHPIIERDGGHSGFLKIARNETRERSQAEELARTRIELVDSEGRFRNMADHAPVMMWVTDRDGHCIYLNRRWYDFTGQTAAEAQGAGWLDATHRDDRAKAARLFRKAHAARVPFRLDYRLRHADGSYHWAIDAASPRFGPEGEFLGYIGSVIDIHDRREAERRLADSEARYRTLFESIESGFCVVEVAPATADTPTDYRVVEANPAFYRQTGFTTAIHGRWLRESMPDLEEHWYEVYGRVAASGEPVRFEQGSAALGRWFDIAAFRVGAPADRRVAVLFNDISARRAAEETLQRLNDRLGDEVTERTAERDRMWETSPDLMLVMDAGGVIHRANPAWTRMLGYDADELIGHHVSDFIVAEDHDETIDAYERAAAGGRSNVENRYRHKDGSIRWIAWVAAPAGDMTYASGRNVTAEKAQAAALAQAEEQLRQAQKMEAVGQLTGGIAHDFNNLLTGVIGSLDLLQRRLARGETDKVERYATAAITSANRAAALTHRLLAFSRRQPLDPKAVDANRLVAGMEELLRRTIGESIAFEMVGAIGLWRTRCDPHQLESAILNLAINARDAMPDGGTLTIETSNARLDAAYVAQQRDVRAGDYVCVCVTDTGTGMSPETIARAFEPFFTTKPIGQGTGLGLSMIYGFARQSEGHVRIYSELGRGTAIKMYLPRHHGAADAADAVAPATDEAHRAAGEVVLVVEDETAVRDLVVEVLRDLGYRAVEAADGPAGLNLLQSGMRVDLLVTDIGLPGLNGRQVADAARQQRPELKVLFMTGYAENATIANGFLEPGMQMITKPFAIDALTARIRGMIEGTSIAGD
ncbi:PAS domain S-box protein [Sphingomonas sp. CD22]|uniref:PAS domain S-box protein n=1 Tax=Sphingomonas sp. CD22 TaxID=3100214 RepID=UPI002AE08C17|nr:PAS domain S-box protein [Sphingomonas sp. CD22]MEA1083490.1 PAS domain S-box protein [Sphingomonas sp. CD22]